MCLMRHMFLMYSLVSFNKYIYYHLNQDIEYDNYLKSPLGILLTVTWQTGWEGSLGENGYMYMCG